VKPWVAVVAIAGAVVIFGTVALVVGNKRLDREFGATGRRSAAQRAYSHADRLAMKLNMAGSSYAAAGMYDSALACFRLALRVAESTGNTRRMAACYSNISYMFDYKNMPESVRFYTDAAVALNRVSRKPDRTIGDLVDMGTFEFATYGNLDSGRVLLEKGLAECLKRGDYGRAELALGNLGSLHAMKGNCDSARVLFESSATLSRALGNRADEAHAMYGIAQVYISRDRSDSAKPWLLKAISIAHSGGIAVIEAQALYDLAVIRAGQGDIDLAAVNVEAARSLFLVMADNDGVGRCRSLQDALIQERRSKNRSRAIDSLLDNQKQESRKRLGS
jgi:tetratricopeptide (TPR) repeat protein